MWMMWSLCLYLESLLHGIWHAFKFQHSHYICAGMGWDISAMGQIVTKWLKETGLSPYLWSTTYSVIGNSIWYDFKNDMIAIFTRGQFWPSGIVVACVCPCGRQSRACPCDNLSLVLTRITKFEPDMQNILVKIPIVFGVDWPWPSSSNLTWKSKFTLFWAFPCNHSPTIEVGNSKFGPKMYLSIDNISINFGLRWPCPSMLFLILIPNFVAKR